MSSEITQCNSVLNRVVKFSPTIARETKKELDSGLRLGEKLPGDNLNWDCWVDIGGAGAKKDESESSE